MTDVILLEIEKILKNIQNNEFSKGLETCYFLLEKNPRLDDIHHLAGSIFYLKEDYQHAITHFEKALSINNQQANYYSDLGLSYSKAHQRQKSKMILQKAVNYFPKHEQILFNLGSLFFEEKNIVLSKKYYQQLLAINPQHKKALYHLALCFLTEDNFSIAEVLLLKAHELYPEDNDILLNLAQCYFTQEKFELSEPIYDDILKKEPTSWAALYNKVFLSERRYNYHESIFYCQKALEIRPDLPEMHHHLSLLLLQQGEFEQGWKEHAWRLKNEKLVLKLWQFTQPLWDGIENLSTTLLVYTEQGYGDSIQFMRYLPLAKKRVGKLVFQCLDPLFILAKETQLVDEVIRYGEALPYHEKRCSLIDLPLLLGNTLEEHPCTAPYLKIEKNRLTHWQNFFSTETRFKIGIVWSGHIEQSTNHHRRCQVEDFLNHLSNDSVVFFSLQLGKPQEEVIPYLKSHSSNLIDLSIHIRDFTDTAAILSCLDLLMTVDTGIAHLAGALKTPTWVLLSKQASWQWLLDRKDSPWYNNLALYRQTCLDQWEDVFQTLKHDLSVVLRFYKPNEKQKKDAFWGDFYLFNKNYLPALTHYENFLKTELTDHSVCINIIAILNMLDFSDEALAYAEKYAAELKNHSLFHRNRSIALAQTGNLTEALLGFQTALKLNHNDPDLYCNLALTLLKAGHYREGWSTYEHRRQRPHYPTKPYSHKPSWLGESLVGKTLVIQTEQGFGDAIQLIRYVDLIKQKKPHAIIVDSPEPLNRLFAYQKNIDAIYTNTPEIPIDYYCPLFSLPKIFNTTLDTIPNQTPYLALDPTWKKTTLTLNNTQNKRVGIVWAGKVTQAINPFRSLPFKQLFTAIRSIPHIDFYSLQVGPAQSSAFPEFGDSMVNMGCHIHDFADTAVILQQLDLLITVCTSTAHLAGALGIPVWVCLHHNADWRWLQERKDSPWYPTATLFRQKAAKQWAPVLTELKLALENWSQDTFRH